MIWTVLSACWAVCIFLLVCWNWLQLRQIQHTLNQIRLRLDGCDVESQTALQSILSVLPDGFVGYAAPDYANQRDAFRPPTTFSYFDSPDDDDLSPDAPEIRDDD